jgi:hypothetical protein
MLWLLLRVYPRYSFKRKIALVVNLITGLLLRMTPSGTDVVVDRIRSCKHYVDNSIFAVLFHKENQNGRIYIYEYTPDCTPISFTKISCELTSNLRIEREAEVLKNLYGRTIRFGTPRIILFRKVGDCLELSMEAAHKGFLTHPKKAGLPREVFDEIAILGGSLQKRMSLGTDCAWLKTATDTIDSLRIKEIVARIPEDKDFAVCAAHCDLGSENVLSRPAANGEGLDYFILDWEYYTDCAPALTDRVSYWLGQRHRYLKRSFPPANTCIILEQLFEDFSRQGHDEQEVTVALLHLVRIGHDLSVKVCGN